MSPDFQVLVDDPPREFAVGVIGKVWKAQVPFVHVSGRTRSQRSRRRGFVKVAWAMRVFPRAGHTHLVLELRVDATDEESWRRFRRYFRLIGRGSRFVRRSALADLARDLGTPGRDEHDRPLPGDPLSGDPVREEPETKEPDLERIPRPLRPHDR